MREALPNAFLFGLTGTPINRRDRNTFMWFGSPMTRAATCPGTRWRTRSATAPPCRCTSSRALSEIHIDEDEINAAFEELAGGTT